jgi:hypothetical protein
MANNTMRRRVMLQPKIRVTKGRRGLYINCIFMEWTSLLKFIKIFQNTPQLCWGDEWPTLSPGGERVRVRGK